MIQGANPPPFDRIRSCPGKHSPTSKSTVATSSQSFPRVVNTYTGTRKTSVGKISSNDLGGCKPSLFVLYSDKDDTRSQTQCFSHESNTYHLGPTRLAQSRRSPQRISRKKSRQVPRQRSMLHLIRTCLEDRRRLATRSGRRSLGCGLHRRFTT